jgi:hypothetical protein
VSELRWEDLSGDEQADLVETMKAYTGTDDQGLLDLLRADAEELGRPDEGWLT